MGKRMRTKWFKLLATALCLIAILTLVERLVTDSVWDMRILIHPAVHCLMSNAQAGEVAVIGVTWTLLLFFLVQILLIWLDRRWLTLPCAAFCLFDMVTSAYLWVTSAGYSAVRVRMKGSFLISAVVDLMQIGVMWVLFRRLSPRRLRHKKKRKSAHH